MMSSCSDAALTYLQRGWAVFPCVPNGKVPLTKHGFKDATTDPALIAQLFAAPCNLAIRTGNGLCVLDIDVRPDRNGHDTLAAWEAQHGALPPTRSATTPSGGQHYYFTCPIPLAGRAALGSGVDVKADGGYVLAPPSVINGKPYAWDQEGELAPLPAWLLTLITGTGKKPLALTSQGQIPRGQQDDELYRLACKLTREGLSAETIRAGLQTAILACVQDPAHPFTSADVTRWMVGAAQLIAKDPPKELPVWAQYHVPMSGKSQPICNADAALQILEQHPLFSDTIWFDTFRNRMLTTWETTTPREWQETDTQRLLVFLQREIRLAKMAKSAVEDALGVFISTRQRHEVQDWLKTLSWDETPRIARCFTTLFGAADTPYLHAVSSNFWISLIARVLRPGCQQDHTVILEGPQGSLKTSALRVIGGKWYTAMSASVMDKDFFQLLPGHWVIELSELDSFNRATQQRIKHILSTPQDTYRASYARLSRTYARQCVFVGTTNETHYLLDTTGARRFWPVACGVIDLPGLMAQRDQLFAEALTRYKKGDAWWEVPAEAREEQEARQEEDAWESPIAEYLLLQEEITLKDVLCDGLHLAVGQIGRTEQLRAAAILRKLGWHSKLVRRGDTILRRWCSLDREPGESLNSGDF